MVDNRIIQIDLYYIEGFKVQKVYYNCIDDDSKSGFQYHLVAKHSSVGDIVIKQYDNEEMALDGLKVIAEKIDAVMLDK